MTHAARIVGAGVAAPLWLGGWRDFLGAPAGVMDAWNEIDIRARIQALTQLPVEFAKDTTAACVAELVFGAGAQHRELPVLVHRHVRRRRAGDRRPSASRSARQRRRGRLVPLLDASQRDARQLLHAASGLALEQLLKSTARTGAPRTTHRALSRRAAAADRPHGWTKLAPALALTVTTAAALLDLDAVVIDGSMDRRLIGEIIARTAQRAGQIQLGGDRRVPELLAGSIGADARAMGGAILPLYRHFAPSRELFLKAEAG